MSNATITKPGPRKHGCYAYFPGTGPTGLTCGGCKHFYSAEISELTIQRRPTKRGICKKWVEMSNGKKPSNIKPSTAACKYYIWKGKKDGTD